MTLSRLAASPTPAGLADGLFSALDRLTGLTGWRRALAAFLFGCLATLALPPFNWFPLLVPALGGLILLLDAAVWGDGKRLRSGFAIGWWFGFGFLVTGLYWISNALLVPPASFAWMIPLALVGLPIALALFVGLVGLAYVRALALGGVMLGPLRVLVFAGLWTLAEYGRGHLFTGFPWNLLAYAWADLPLMQQPAALGGAYLLSLLTVFLAALPVALVRPVLMLPGEDAPLDPATSRLLAGGQALLLLAGWIGFGALRLFGAEPVLAGDRPLLRLVQPNIAQSLKWADAERAANFRKHLDLSARPYESGVPAAIIWPETATAFALEQSPAAIAEIARITPPGGIVITGTPRLTRFLDGRLTAWNSMVAYDGSGRLLGSFDKFHLVPFGEYVPFRTVLPIDKITPGAVDYSPGPGPQTLTLGSLPTVSPLICYEVIFPGEVMDRTNRAQWLLNLTNDGWYGYSTGPFQHFASSALRAVEEGVPMVRVANTGISGIVDPYGRVTVKADLETESVVDGRLPRAISAATTYSRMGDLVLLIGLFLAFVPLIFVRVRKLIP